jgi:hypothetical protein
VLIEECKNVINVDDQIVLLFQINNQLPKSQKLCIPSLISRDYISKALDMIQDRLRPVNIPLTT